MKQQIYVSQPSENGGFEVAKLNEKGTDYIPTHFKYTHKLDADNKARELNGEL